MHIHDHGAYTRGAGLKARLPGGSKSQKRGSMHTHDQSAIPVVQDSKLDDLFMLELATSPIRRTEPELVSAKLKLHVWAV